MMAAAQSNEKPLANVTALVTGASRGIGQAIARRLGELGARIGICARDAAKLEATASALRRDGIEVLAIPADVTRVDEIQNLVNRIHRELGPIEILVNNAGIGRFGPAHEMAESDWDQVLDTNLKSVFLVSRAIVPKMIEQTPGPHYQYQLARGEKCVRRRRYLLRLKMGIDGSDGVHGRGFARIWNSRQRCMPGQRGDRLFTARWA